MKREYVLSILVRNRPGVLTKIAGMFYRRGHNISTLTVGKMHKEGISVASINYRLTKEGLLAEGENMYPAPMHDGARAIQFLRHNATKYNVDKTDFAATGGDELVQCFP